METMGQMDHSEAVNLMAAERYLLGELPPGLRDAFEEHLFDCPECAFDIRAGVAFVDEAKVQLPELTVPAPPETAAHPPARPGAEPHKGGWWTGWWGSLFSSPAFAAPLFAALLLTIGYQNLVTLPALRSEATEPRLLPVAALHAGTRSGSATVIAADRKAGVLLQVELPGGTEAYTALTVDLYNPQGTLAWSRSFPPNAAPADAGTLSVAIPGPGLQAGEYSLAVSGIDASGQRNALERIAFDVQFHN